MKIEDVIDDVQCPGCVCGNNTKECDKVKIETVQNVGGPFQRCTGHVPGTSMGIPGVLLTRLFLGLPKGFNRFQNKDTMIRIWMNGPPTWDDLNVPVWASMYQSEGVSEPYLLVRTYMPRVETSVVDVILNGKIEDAVTDSGHKAIDVSELRKEID